MCIFIKKEQLYSLAINLQKNLEEIMMKTKELNVLLVSSSARESSSITRRFADEMLAELRSQHGQINIQYRDVSKGLPFVDEQWVNANFTPADQRTDEHKSTLALSDSLVEELKLADVVLIASPIYNFGIPASLKAWIDQISRVGLTFNFTSDGSIGVLQNKKAYIVMASGGTLIGSDVDFASGYLRHVMEFIGIDDVSLISAEKFDQNNEQATVDIRERILDLATTAA